MFSAAPGGFLPVAKLAQPQERLLGRRLLRGLLAATLAAADYVAPHPRGNLETPIVRRARLARHVVADPRSVPCELLLERRLEVEERLRGKGDLVREGVDDRPRRRPEAVMDVA